MEPRTCIEAEPYALRVTDESMAPEFPRGCIVIVDPTGLAADGAFVLAEHKDELIFRRLRLKDGDFRLEALAVGYEVVRPQNGLAAIRGIVVQRAGRRRRDHKRYG